MFSASDVKTLREKTGAGMLDCKKALQETNGNMDAAIDYLREKGIAKAAKKGERIGTISVYDIVDKCCESGRLAIKGNAFQAIEAQMLIFKFAFEYLGMNTVVGYIFADNERAIRFNKQFGCILDKPEPHDNGHMMVKATYTKEAVEKATERIKRMIYR